MSFMLVNLKTNHSWSKADVNPLHWRKNSMVCLVQPLTTADVDFSQSLYYCTGEALRQVKLERYLQRQT